MALVCKPLSLQSVVHAAGLGLKLDGCIGEINLLMDLENKLMQKRSGGAKISQPWDALECDYFTVLTDRHI